METTCNCGAVHVRIDDDELFSKRRGHICHCNNCRKTASSAYSVNLIIEESKVTITGIDNLACYEDPKTTSGNIVKRYFCKTCGNPIKSEAKAISAQGKVILKLGIFDKLPLPEFEAFVMDRQAWVKAQAGMAQFVSVVGGELCHD